MVRKACEIEELNMRLLIEEFNELQQSSELKIIDVDVNKLQSPFKGLAGHEMQFAEGEPGQE